MHNNDDGYDYFLQQKSAFIDNILLKRRRCIYFERDGGGKKGPLEDVSKNLR